MLAEAGITGTPALVSLYGAALLDVLLGLLVLVGYRIALIGALQIAVIVSYSAVISIFLPELWLHPFGPITKNLPFIAGILVLIAAEKR